MGVTRRKRLTRLLLRVALALAVGCLFAPAQARASCGDYVSVGSDSGHPTPDNADTSQSPKRVPPPCHGPSCSGMPSSLPMAAPPAPALEKEIAAVACPTPLREPQPLDLTTECPDRDAVRRGCSVFHPPRTSPTPFLR
jgi:hypothetical protein